MQQEILKDIVILYHAHCQDGFGSAFAAWKRLGDNASYIPVSDRKNPPQGLTGKEVYIVDFSYPKEVFLELEKIAKKLVVIDHHISAREAVESVREYIFSVDHAGAYLSWQYFVGTDVPTFIKMLEIIDTAKDTADEHGDVITYILSKPYTFEAYEQLLFDLDNPDMADTIKAQGKAQNDYLNLLLDGITSEPEFILFEGYTIPCINTYLPINEKSIMLRKLYERYPPFAMSYRFDEGFLKISLRGNGTIDVSELAAKYGGGGHRSSAGFIVKADTYPLPFATPAPKEDR